MKYNVEELKLFARSLLEAIGLDSDKSKAVGDILVEGDLLGHTTHGLGLLGPYLAELESGKMNKEGLPEVVSDFPAAMTWDGRRLPVLGLFCVPWTLQLKEPKSKALARL